jgi:hypothetical protein
VNDTARVLLTAALLSGLTLVTFAWRITRLDREEPARLIGELRLAQWAAVLLAGVAMIPLGLVLGSPDTAHGNIDAAVAVIFLGLSGLLLQRDPRDGLLFVSGAFVLHALVDIMHRPGWLPQDLAPRWFTLGCALYNVAIAAVCYLARRR